MYLFVILQMLQTNFFSGKLSFVVLYYKTAHSLSVFVPPDPPHQCCMYQAEIQHICRFRYLKKLIIVSERFVLSQISFTSII